MPGVKDTTSFPHRQLGLIVAAVFVMDRAEWLQPGWPQDAGESVQ